VIVEDLHVAAAVTEFQDVRLGIEPVDVRHEVSVPWAGGMKSSASGPCQEVEEGALADVARAGDDVERGQVNGAAYKALRAFPDIDLGDEPGRRY
jgi:hypothetical protein